MLILHVNFLCCPVLQRYLPNSLVTPMLLSTHFRFTYHLQFHLSPAQTAVSLLLRPLQLLLSLSLTNLNHDYCIPARSPVLDPWINDERSTALGPPIPQRFRSVRDATPVQTPIPLHPPVPQIAARTGRARGPHGRRDLHRPLHARRDIRHDA